MFITFSFTESLFESRTAETKAETHFAYCTSYASGRCTSAVTFLWYRFAQRHMLPSGVMIVFPNRVNEYSTLIAFDLVTRLAINPVNSRLRRVLVSIRWETLPRWRRNCPCR
jgi:hypothetical protein